MQTADVLAALTIAVGLVGIVVPLLPGTLLIGAAALGWAWYVGGGTAWGFALAAVAVLVVGTVVKYAVPGRNLKASGIPNRTLLAGGVLGVVGFFVVPVVGLVLGFVVGIYLSELQRLGSHAAWPATLTALKAVGLSLLIELAAGMCAAVLWLVAAFTT
ncbi:DUF456 domain-containing protein [Nocardioides caldifontis]|uniref:DUF456 domain-containing protein n=1 Tax=Nocardioides caldifontis TaxID=2588938 RepID=UPI0011DFA72B|nr:DUF456 domain-containing protein [Nocardioides caldifontis]